MTCRISHLYKQYRPVRHYTFEGNYIVPHYCKFRYQLQRSNSWRPHQQRYKGYSFPLSHKLRLIHPRYSWPQVVCRYMHFGRVDLVLPRIGY